MDYFSLWFTTPISNKPRSKHRDDELPWSQPCFHLQCTSNCSVLSVRWPLTMLLRLPSTRQFRSGLSKLRIRPQARSPCCTANNVTLRKVRDKIIHQHHEDWQDNWYHPNILSLRSSTSTPYLAPSTNSVRSQLILTRFSAEIKVPPFFVPRLKILINPWSSRRRRIKAVRLIFPVDALGCQVTSTWVWLPAT